MKNYTAWIDGSILHNGKPNAVSASAALIEKENPYGGEKRFLISYKNGNTTSNKAEMYALIQLLKYIKWPSRFVVYSDSEYVVKGVNERLKDWVSGGWKTKRGTPVANKSLWLEVENLVNYHDVCMIWTKGHADDENHNVVDKLARDVMRNPEEFANRHTYLGKRLIFL